MKTRGKALLVSASTLFLTCMLIILASPVVADETFIWTAQVFSSGAEVVSPTLHYGVQYRIVASERWWYNWLNNLAADAQYYTTDPINSDYWGNNFTAPGGASFLQINGQNVTWGPFSNGDTGHTYTIYYTGSGTPLTFRIVDWMDQNYTNNVCHIHVTIYSVVTVGGRIADSTPWETDTYFAISALIVTAAIAVPIIRYQRKTQKRND